MALIIKNYWALYFGIAAGTIIPTIGVCVASRWIPSPPRRVAGLREMLKFGAGVTSANVSNFLAGNMDNVLIGWKWGDHALGLYDRAYKLLLFPLQRIVGPVMGTMVPVLSRLTAEPERYRRIFLKTVAQIALATWPGIVWAIVLNDTLVPTLLGNQWMDAAAIFTPLAIAGLLQTANYFTACLFISQGRSGEYARWSLFSAVTSVVAFVIGLPYGAVGVAVAFAAIECLRTPVLWCYATRRGPVRISDAVNAVLPQIVSAFSSAWVLLAYRQLAQAPPIFLLVGGLLLSYAVFTLTMSLSSGGRETLKQTLAAGKQMLMHFKSTAGD